MHRRSPRPTSRHVGTCCPASKKRTPSPKCSAGSQHLLIPTTVVWVALDAAGELVGFSARKDEWLEQLYLRPATLRQGVGTQLLSLAKTESPEGLSLYTFQRNLGARAFYERHGFELVLTRDGSNNEEQEPDVLYRWKR